MNPFRATMSFVLFAAIFIAASPAFAQRPIPADNGQPFVEQADPGSLCPSCQVLLLKDSYAPTEPMNVYSPVLATKIKPSVDVLIVDTKTGNGLLVKTALYGYVPGGFSALGIFENIEWVLLREGVFWTTGDLDGDGRDDLVGHDKRTGEVIRVYRRGAR